MKPLRATPLVTHRSPDTLGEAGLLAGRRALRARSLLGDRAVQSAAAGAPVVAQPWHGYEKSAPDDLSDQNPSQRINRLALESSSPDRRLTGERTAEGWANGPHFIGPAAVASGDAEFSPRVRVLQLKSCRALRMREAEERNLLP